MRRQAPLVGCRGGCGRRRRTWRDSWLCRFCLLADREASPESFRATQRRLNGRCPVCGLNPCGCEFGPKVDELAPGIKDKVRRTGYAHAGVLAGLAREEVTR